MMDDGTMEDEETPPAARSSDEQRRLRLAFEERRERQRKVGILFAGALGLIVGAGVLLRLPADYWIPMVGAIALAAVVFSLVNWRCPACGARLGARRTPSSCPDCEAPLE
jgi:rubrerythrin